VHRDFLKVLFLAKCGQGYGRASVKPGAAQDVALIENRLAHERMRELGAPRTGSGPQQSGAEDLVKRGLGGTGLQPRRGLQSTCVVLEAKDRSRDDQLVRVIAHARQPRADRVPDTLRHGVRPGFGQLSQDLLDKERIAVGSRVYT
jgi:hypothetical protein